MCLVYVVHTMCYIGGLGLDAKNYSYLIAAHICPEGTIGSEKPVRSTDIHGNWLWFLDECRRMPVLIT